MVDLKLLEQPITRPRLVLSPQLREMSKIERELLLLLLLVLYLLLLHLLLPPLQLLLLLQIEKELLLLLQILNNLSATEADLLSL